MLPIQSSQRFPVVMPQGNEKQVVLLIIDKFRHKLWASNK